MSLVPLRSTPRRWVNYFRSSVWGGFAMGFAVIATFLTDYFKISLGVPFSQASYHQIVMISTRYTTQLFTSFSLYKVGGKTFATLGAVCTPASFLILYLWSVLDSDISFLYIQIIYGLLLGTGSGIMMSCVSIIPQVRLR